MSKPPLKNSLTIKSDPITKGRIATVAMVCNIPQAAVLDRLIAAGLAVIWDDPRFQAAREAQATRLDDPFASRDELVEGSEQLLIELLARPEPQMDPPSPPPMLELPLTTDGPDLPKMDSPKLEAPVTAPELLPGEAPPTPTTVTLQEAP